MSEIGKGLTIGIRIEQGYCRGCGVAVKTRDAEVILSYDKDSKTETLKVDVLQDAGMDCAFLGLNGAAILVCAVCHETLKLGVAEAQSLLMKKIVDNLWNRKLDLDRHAASLQKQREELDTDLKDRGFIVDDSKVSQDTPTE